MNEEQMSRLFDRIALLEKENAKLKMLRAPTVVHWVNGAHSTVCGLHMNKFRIESYSYGKDKATCIRCLKSSGLSCNQMWAN